MRKLALGLIAAASTMTLGVIANAAPPSEAWEIGPIIKGRNYSQGMAVTPTATSRGWMFRFPGPAVENGHVHYLTYRHGPLAGARRITLHYRIDAAKGTRFVPRQYPQQTAKLSLYFQRHGDRWSGKRQYGQYRWYAPSHSMVPITPGTHKVSVNLDDPAWISVWGEKASTKQEAFLDALEDTDRVGFVFGSDSARGHGVFATGRATFTLLEFRVE